MQQPPNERYYGPIERFCFIFRIGQLVPEIWPEHVPVNTGCESKIGLNGVKPIMRHLKSHQNSITRSMAVKLSTQDHIGHIRTCSRYPRGSGQFLTWTKTHHATPQIHQNSITRSMSVKLSTQDH